MVYNAVECCHTAADYDETSKALPPGRAFIVYLEGEWIMAVSYKKLWKLLIDKDIKKKDLSAIAGISPATITKMGKGGHVTTEVLLKICKALNCGIDDVVEFL
jgi:DNA-binding Xre family transcriptional regulator